MKKLLTLFLALIVVFVLVLLTKTMMFSSRQMDVAAVTPAVVEPKAATARLTQALQFKTISHKDPEKFDPAMFLGFHDFLERSYPLVHQKLERQVINRYSLLYKWQGTDTSLKPVLLNAHMDVVPIEPGTEADWKYDPFHGVVEEGYIWGRDAIDMKSTLTAIMEAVERRLEKGHSPHRTIYLSFGHDEELGGDNGAKNIAAYLRIKAGKSKAGRGTYTKRRPFVHMKFNGIEGAFPVVMNDVDMVTAIKKGYLTVEGSPEYGRDIGDFMVRIQELVT